MKTTKKKFFQGACFLSAFVVLTTLSPEAEARENKSEPQIKVDSSSPQGDVFLTGKLLEPAWRRCLVEQETVRELEHLREEGVFVGVELWEAHRRLDCCLGRDLSEESCYDLQVSLDRSWVIFPDTTLGSSAPSQRVVLLNMGTGWRRGLRTGQVFIESVDVIGPAAGDFHITGNECFGRLGYGHTCGIETDFWPSETGERSAYLRIRIRPRNYEEIRARGETMVYDEFLASLIGIGRVLDVSDHRGTIGGAVYADLNGDGDNEDFGEGTLTGVNVTLTGCGGTLSAITGFDGTFSFHPTSGESCSLSVSRSDWIFTGTFPAGLSYPISVALDPSRGTSLSILMSPMSR